jgi:histone-lysine N-methyltransferase SETD3
MTGWLDEGQSDYSKLEMRWYWEGYRGVHAKTFIRKNECILYIPKSHIITLEMAKAAPIGSKMVEAKLNLLSPKHCYLSTFLL